MPIAASLLAIVCGIAAMRLSSGRRAHFLVPVSGILLAAVTVFGLIPEVRKDIGWVWTLTLAALGFFAFTLLDRAGVAVCPSCQHGDVIAGPLVAAIGVHAFVDGWALVATGTFTGAIVSKTIAGAMLLHKIPEGLALGALLRPRGIALLIAAESATVVGGIFGLWAAPGFWMSYLLAIAGGTFLFFGLHAVLNGRH